MEELKIKLTAPEFNAIKSGTQTEIYFATNNKWGKKLCRKKAEKHCTNTDCKECMKLGFAYKIFDKLTIEQGKNTVSYPIVNISRGTGDVNLGAKEGEIYFIVRFTKE